jgi:hypothetical protein
MGGRWNWLRIVSNEEVYVVVMLSSAALFYVHCFLIIVDIIILTIFNLSYTLQEEWCKVIAIKLQ